MQINLNDFYDLPRAQIIRIKLKNNPNPIYGWMAIKRPNLTSTFTLFGHMNQVLNIKQLKEGTGCARIKLIQISSDDFEEFGIVNTAEVAV